MNREMEPTWVFHCNKCRQLSDEGYWTILIGIPFAQIVPVTFPCTPFATFGASLLLLCERCMIWATSHGIGFMLHRAVPMRFYCTSCENSVVIFSSKCMRTLEYEDRVVPCPVCREPKVFTKKDS